MCLIREQKTRVINLFGGPNTGKSVLALQLVAKLKLEISDLSIEYLGEFAKSFAYSGQQIVGFNQLWVTMNQAKLLLDMLNSGVDLIITDSPVLLGLVYARKYKSEYLSSVYELVNTFTDLYGRYSLNLILDRSDSILYQQIGRFESEFESKLIDSQISELVSEEMKLPYLVVDPTKFKDVYSLVRANLFTDPVIMK
jgi:nicotinamide riboside kinase